MVFYKPFADDLATWNIRPGERFSMVVETPELLLPWYLVVPPPLKDRADARERVPGLKENSICPDMVAEDWHECYEESFSIAFILCKHGLDICWKTCKLGWSRHVSGN